MLDIFSLEAFIKCLQEYDVKTRIELFNPIVDVPALMNHCTSSTTRPGPGMEDSCSRASGFGWYIGPFRTPLPLINGAHS